VIALSLVASSLIVAAAVAWRPSGVPDGTRPVMRFALPISGLPVGVWQGLAISPDGLRVVYATPERLTMRTLGSVDPVPLSGTESVAGEAPTTPFFSPDGRTVAFYHQGELRKLAVPGGPPVTICDLGATPFGASWGENDEILLGRYGGIFRVPAQGGRPTQLFTLPEETAAANPQSLPGGQWVLYMVPAPNERPDEWRVVVHSRTTDERRMVLDGARYATYVSSGHLVYGRGHALFVVPFNPAEGTVTGAAIPVLDGVANLPSPAMQFGVSSTGTLVYLPGSPTAGGAATRLVQVTRTGVRAPLADVPGVAWYPRYSPDGGRIAYATSADSGFNTPSDLWVADVRRRARTRVTFGGNNRFYPVWTRDGRSLTFADGTASTNRVHRVLADGSGVLETLIDAGTRAYPTSWSPDGKTLALYVSAAGNSGTGSPASAQITRDIWMLDADADKRTQRPFITGPFEERGGIFSPNGRWVAYVSNKSRQNEVFARPYPGPGTEVTISVGGGHEPVWAPSGEEIFYRHGGKLQAVRVQEVNDTLNISAPRELFDDPYRPDTAGMPGGVANYDVAPDGQHFVMVELQRQEEDTVPQLQLVLNWFEEVQRLAAMH
jgi:serine/threonine-protein kinase